MGLKKSDNYTTYVELDRKYVTYVVSAAPKNKLEHYTWWFPIVGSVPYKGYFHKEGAKELHEDLKEKNLDVHTRGVSAYSTLGWFNDPLLSSMMRYSDYSLVNTIIHENVHATIFISSSANFNERLATFLGNIGAELYFKKNYPNSSEILEDVENRNHDKRVFSKFISQEIKDLKKWYEDRENTEINEEERQKRLKQINENYISKAKPKLKSKRYNYFENMKLNNALLMQYKLYVSDLSDFEKMFNLLNRDLAKFIEFCKSLEDADKPSKELKNKIKEFEAKTASR